MQPQPVLDFDGRPGDMHSDQISDQGREIRGVKPASKRLGTLARRSPASAGTSGLCARTSLADVDLAPAKVGAVKRAYRGLRLALGRHFNESEAFGLATELVLNDVHGRDFSVRTERFAQIV